MGQKILASLIAFLVFFASGVSAGETREKKAASPDKKPIRVEKEKKDARIKDEDVVSELEMLQMMEMLEHIDMLNDMDVIDGGDSK